MNPSVLNAPSSEDASLAALLAEIRACRLCREEPCGTKLPHEPRPVLRVSRTARIGVFGQAPGTRVHASGTPFTDPSGVRLRRWMGVTDDEFYDVTRVAVIPMGFCFPGLNQKGGDLPPRKECAPRWRNELLHRLPNLKTVLLLGAYAHAWHLADLGSRGLTQTVINWREIIDRPTAPRFWPMPHPSWRNNRWLKDNPWFEEELLPPLRREIRLRLDEEAP